MSGRFSWGADDEFPLPPCWVCYLKHANEGSCDAYPDEIPVQIMVVDRRCAHLEVNDDADSKLVERILGLTDMYDEH